MKQKKVLSLLLLATQLQASPILTFFYVPFPQARQAQKTLQALHKPHAVSKRALLALGNHNPVAGIFSTYYGFIDASNHMGQTSFPLKQSNKKIALYVTPKITPIMRFNNTVSHWELVPGAPSAAYTYEMKEDPETKLSVWEVSSASIPENNILPAIDSVIIIAKPQNIFIPLGATLIEKPDANFQLPDIYAKQGINITQNALYLLNFTFLFRPVDLLYKKDKLNYETLVAE